jgi:hypothetical protein
MPLILPHAVLEEVLLERCSRRIIFFFHPWKTNLLQGSLEPKARKTQAVPGTFISSEQSMHCQRDESEAETKMMRIIHTVPDIWDGVSDCDVYANT